MFGGSSVHLSEEGFQTLTFKVCLEKSCKYTVVGYSLYWFNDYFTGRRKAVCSQVMSFQHLNQF